MAGKEKIHLYVDADIFEAFRNYVYSKYGTLNKYLGEEISRAMEFYLRHVQQNLPSHTQEFEHMISKQNKKHIQLLVWLLKNFPYEVLYSDIMSYINDNYGFDRRTVKKYLHDFLINGGFVENLRSTRGNRDFILKVNAERIVSYLSKFISEIELREKYGIYKEAYEKARAKEEIEQTEQNKQVREEIRQYVVERYEAGDSLDEITHRLADFGVVLGKRAVRSIVRKARREEHV